jgi:hypothetical protein
MVNAMDELVKSLANRITRDFAYFIGGGTLILSVWLVCLPESGFPYERVPSIAYFLLLGIAYVVGFVVQELFSLIPGFSTTLIIGNWRSFYRRALASLYEIYTREQWNDNIEGYRVVDAYNEIGKRSEPIKALIDRTATLKHLGTCIGPCALLSGFLLALSGCHPWLGIALLVIGVVLIALGRLKTMQQIAFLRATD